MTPETTTTIEWLQESSDTWKIRTLIAADLFSNSERLLKLIRALKMEVSKRSSIAIEALEFMEVAEKEETAHGTIATFVIQRLSIEKGEPLVRIVSGISPEGVEFPEMHGVLDICYLDPFDRVITFDRVVNSVKSSGISDRCLDTTAVREAYEKTIQQRSKVSEHIIATGTFPEPSTDAQVEIFFPAEPNPSNISEYVKTRRVKEGDYLGQKLIACDGRAPGLTVKGNVLKPSRGIDIELVAGDGTRSAPLENLVIAGRDGIIEVQQQSRKIQLASGSKTVPTKIELMVKSIQVVESIDSIRLISDEVVEVRGDLASGSEIISRSDVIVTGSVQEGSYIQSFRDVIVQGGVNGSMVSSERNVIVQGDIFNSQVKSGHSIFTQGAVTDAVLSGLNIQADVVKNSRLFASCEAIIGQIEREGRTEPTKVVIGLDEFYRMRLTDNERIIGNTYLMLDRFRKMFGEELVENVTPNNLQMMFIRYMSRLSANGEARRLSRDELIEHRKLLEALPGVKEFLAYKKEETADIERKLRQPHGSEPPSLKVLTRISASTAVELNGVPGTLSPQDGPLQVQVVEGQLVVTEMDG